MPTFPPFHITQDGDEKVRLQASEERGTAQYFGERALLNNEPRAATVKVISKDAKALVSRSPGSSKGGGRWRGNGMIGSDDMAMVLKTVCFLGQLFHVNH